jgi:hypothetical protein
MCVCISSKFIVVTRVDCDRWKRRQQSWLPAKQWQEYGNRRERHQYYAQNAAVGGASTKESERNQEQHVTPFASEWIRKKNEA